MNRSSVEKAAILGEIGDLRARRLTMGALDQLLGTWRSNPDADSTVALCAYVGSSGEEELVREIGKTAETWHARDAAVMLAVGRMYLDAGLMPEAQAALVSAGKLDAASPRPFRYLGEVLLRRGDAIRAEKVMARAIQLGLNDTETRHLHDRAAFYMALQKRVGAPAVALEVQRALPKQLSIPAPTLRAQSFSSDDITNPRGKPDPLPRFDSTSEVSQAEVPAAPPVPAAPKHKVRAHTMIGVAPPAGRAAPAARVVMPAARATADNTLPEPPPARPAGADDKRDSLDDDPTTIARRDVAVYEARHARAHNPFDAPTRPAIERSSSLPAPGKLPSSPVPPAAAARQQPSRVKTAVGPTSVPSEAPAARRVATPAPVARRVATPAPVVRRVATPAPPATQGPAFSDPFAAPEHAAPPEPAPAPAPAFAPRRTKDLRNTQPEPFPSFGAGSRGAAPSAAPTARYDAGPPPAGVLLEHLARVGLFEPGGGAAPAWEQPPRQKTRGVWAMLAAIVLISGAGVGGWQYARHLKAQKVERASILAKEVDRMLHTGVTAELRATDQKLSEAFDLDSRSQRAARLWLENRVLRTLMLGEDTQGINSAIHRGRTVGLPEKDLAVGRMASFLSEGDLAGAAAQLPKWDKEAGKDALYQLAAGTVLEHAGDLRAIERYEAARALDPKLVPADIMLGRLALLELGGERAKPVLDTLESKTGKTPAVRALRALSWIVDPARPSEPPSDAVLAPDDAAKLPAPLAGVPPVLEAMRALKSGDRATFRSSLEEAIQSADSPALASGLGFLAIETGDETLARKAALRAVGFAALYPRARTLAARVALLGGRVDEAQKAIEQLDPASVEVAVVRAVAAYESLEPADVDAALKTLGEQAKNPSFAALATGSAVLLGTGYPALGERDALIDPTVPWGELVVLDTAIAQGDLAFAESLLAGRTGDALRPVHLRRLARLRRYQKKPAEAVAASQSALEGSVTAPVLIERVYDLVAAEDSKAARDTIARYPVVLGTLSGWLAAFVDAHSSDKGDTAQAAARVAKLELPPDASPLDVRLLALRALVVTKDKRGKPYLNTLARVAPKHPEIQLAIDDVT